MWMLNSFRSSAVTLTDDQKTASFYELDFPKTLDGSDFDPKTLKGKVVIITNSASKCGFTDGHYKELEAMYQKHKKSDLEILAFPCAQFNNQEHADSCNIRSHADKFKITFPIFEKIKVNGEGAHPLFQWLKLNSKKFGGPKSVNYIGWNFGKFLVSKEGRVLGYYGPLCSPSKMERQVEEALK